MTPLRKLAAILVAASAVVAAVSCSGSGNKDSADALTVGWVVDPSWAQVPVANDLGYFKQNGVNVKVVPFPTGAAALEALNGGAVDIANGGDVPTSAAVLKNSHLRIIADGAIWPEGRFVARRSAGIDSIAALGGRKIAVPLGSSAHYFASRFLAEGNVNADLVQTGPAEIVTAIANHDVDAIAVFQPALAKAVQALGTDAIELQGTQKYNQHSLYLINDNTLTEKKPAVTKFVASIREADAALTEKNPEALAAVAKSVGLDQNLINQVTTEFVYKTHLGPELAGDLADRARWAQSIGRIPANQTIPDYQSVIVGSVVSGGNS
ncbi:MAG TPA: NrtA/SsuA/CpmA family ABC transporter substrate-binding protein [Mycobacterium sp.]|nr:NrtA/SsuA/CpmA family ABC transporter substrate-binding protein [Mycobacterium sp.]